MRISDGISDVCFSDLPVPHDMADLVARRLARPDGVAIDLALAAAAGDAGSGDEIIGRLLAAPALGVKARVDHEAGRPEQVRLEHPGPTQRVALEHPNLVGQLLGIERPALDRKSTRLNSSH